MTACDDQAARREERCGYLSLLLPVLDPKQLLPEAALEVKSRRKNVIVRLHEITKLVNGDLKTR